MGTVEIAAKVKELKELQRMAEELTAEMETIKDTIKNEMTARSVDELTTNEYRIVWATVKSSRFDSAAFRKANPDAFALFSRPTESRPLKIL